MKKVALLIIAILALTGCAPKAYKPDPKKSHALNVLRAAGAKDTKDIPRKKFEEAQAKNTSTGQIHEPAKLADATFAGVTWGLSNPGAVFGISSLLEGGAFFVWTLLDTNDPPEKFSSVPFG